MNGDLTSRAQRVAINAVFSHPPTAALFVLKGAHAAALLADTRRATRDVDLTGRPPSFESADAGKAWLSDEFGRAMRAYVDRVANDWSVYAVSVRKRPESKPHRFGWDGYLVKLTLQYRGRAQHVVEIDISFGDLTDGIVTLVPSPGDPEIVCYSREQIIAEKMRAFLQHLPPHRDKIGLTPESLPRVRDLGDIHFLSRNIPLDIPLVGRLLREKCLAKSVDLVSFDDFLPPPMSVEIYSARFAEEAKGLSAPTATPRCAFDDAWNTLRSLVEAIEQTVGLPGKTPMPRVR